MAQLKTITEEYQILDTLGNGANANVYKARHRKLGYITAIKILNHPIADENSLLYQRFIQECKVLLRLGNGGHDHIVKVGNPRLMVHYEMEDRKDNRATVEMEFIEGRSLYDFLNDHKGHLPLSEVFNLLTGISSALAYCHHDVYKHCINKDEDFDQIVVDGHETYKLKPVDDLVKRYKIEHNDIHSRNIIRRTNGRYVLLDFGLAITSETAAKSSLRTKGNPEYKAPEKWDRDNVTAQSDIYSFGILMYEALTGMVPFPEQPGNEDYNLELMKKHREVIPPALLAQRPDCPQWLEQVIFKCLEKDPGNRFKNGKELFDAISKEIEKEFKQEHDEQALIEKLKNDIRFLKNRAEEKDKELLSIQAETSMLKNTIDRLNREDKWREGEQEALRKKNEAQLNELAVAAQELKEAREMAARSSGRLARNKSFKQYFYAASLCCLALLAGMISMYRSPDTKTYMATDARFHIDGDEYSYTGEMKKGLPNGKGKAVFKNGDQFEGHLADGKLLFGKYLWKESQNRFEGSFADGHFYTGVATFADGTHHSTIAQKLYDCLPNQ